MATAMFQMPQSQFHRNMSFPFVSPSSSAPNLANFASDSTSLVGVPSSLDPLVHLQRPADHLKNQRVNNNLMNRRRQSEPVFQAAGGDHHQGVSLEAPWVSGTQPPISLHPHPVIHLTAAPCQTPVTLPNRLSHSQGAAAAAKEEAMDVFMEHVLNEGIRQALMLQQAQPPLEPHQQEQPQQPRQPTLPPHQGNMSADAAASQINETAPRNQRGGVSDETILDLIDRLQRFEREALLLRQCILRIATPEQRRKARLRVGQHDEAVLRRALMPTVLPPYPFPLSTTTVMQDPTQAIAP